MHNSQMQLLHDWLARKAGGRSYRLRVPVRVTETFRKYTGPRYIFGQVTLSAVPASEFGYSSQVDWPVGESAQLYEDSILEGILDVILAQRATTVLGIAVTLEEVAWDQVESCAYGYRMAAQQAMHQILGAGGSESESK
jgi:hypothetical protein